MFSDVAIKVAGVSKRFPIYAKPHHRLMQMFMPGPRHRWYREFEALKNVSLTVHKGETVGIVGRNGSGKSTLLQLICGTLTPSQGSVEVHGRIAALLELGSGFNPEFTGRENVYLNGTVLGLSHAEIDGRFDDIVAFADIGEFIDQPVKSYSSGMAVRLAFAVAINVTPDILVVDEALSVGDEAFQRKCFARIGQIRDAGATVLFVSHSAGTVVELCDRAVLLDHGDLLLEGSPKYVVSNYHRLVYAPADKAEEMRAELRSTKPGIAIPKEEPVALEENSPAEEQEEFGDADLFDPGLISQSVIRYESKGATIRNPRIETLDGEVVNILRPNHDYIYTYNVTFQRASIAVRMGMMIKTISGLELGGAVTSPHGVNNLMVEPGQEVEARFQFRTSVAPGVYFMNAGVSAHDMEGETYLDRIIDAAVFRVRPEQGRLATGLVDFSTEPTFHLIESKSVTA